MYHHVSSNIIHTQVKLVPLNLLLLAINSRYLSILSIMILANCRPKIAEEKPLENGKTALYHNFLLIIEVYQTVLTDSTEQHVSMYILPTVSDYSDDFVKLSK